MLKHLEEEKNFKEEINKDLVLVDFYASWCGPCKMISPIIEEIEKENTSLNIIKVDVDKFPNIAREYKVMSIPTLIVFKNGEITNTKVGFTNKEEIKNLLK